MPAPVALAQSLLHRLGVHLSRYPLHSEFENVLHDFLIAFQIGSIIDVGANVGRYAMALRRIGYSGRITSFEPVERTFAELERNARGDPSWSVQQIALGASDGTAMMHVYPGHENSTFRDVGEFAREWLPSALEKEEQQSVPVRRLDGLVSNGAVRLDCPTLLKIDAEGSDWQVIEGAGDRMEELAGVQLELMVQPVWKNTPTISESVARLHEMGFDPVAFSVPNRAHFSAIVMDGLFRNVRFLPDASRASQLWNPGGMGLEPQLWKDADRSGFRRGGSGASWNASD